MIINKLSEYNTKLYEINPKCECEYIPGYRAKICKIHIIILNNIKNDKDLSEEQIYILCKEFSYNLCGILKNLSN